MTAYTIRAVTSTGFRAQDVDLDHGFLVEPQKDDTIRFRVHDNWFAKVVKYRIVEEERAILSVVMDDAEHLRFRNAVRETGATIAGEATQ